MNPPFSITIEITQATQCHAAVSQLLRVFPSLSLTIIANETEPVTSRPPQTIGFADIPALVAACIAALLPLDQCLGSAAEAGRMGADEAREAAERACPWKPAESRAKADAFAYDLEGTKARAQAELDAIDRGDDNPDAGTA